MNRQVFRYVFRDSVPFEEVQRTLDLAVTTAEILCGEPKVRLHAGCATDPDKRAVAIDASAEVGETLNEIFVGYLHKNHGRHAFSVERVDRPQGAAS